MVRTLVLAMLLAFPGLGYSQQAAVRGAGLDGLFLAIQTNRLSNRMYHDYLAFFPNGRVLRDDPSEGLGVEVDLEAACRDNPCGSYKVQGNTVAIDWAGGPREVYERSANGALKRRGATHTYRPLPLLEELRLNGRFAVRDDRGQELVGIAFTPDGRFTENNLLNHTNWVLLGDRVERARTAVPGGEGTYRIHRNTLELRYDNGPTARFVITIPPGVPVSSEPEAVYISRSRLARIS